MNTVRGNIIRGASWPGAFFGLVISLFTYLFLMILGAAIGGSVFSFNNAGDVGWGALVWLAVALGISAFLGSFAGSRGAPGLTTRSAAGYTGVLCGALLLLSLSMLAVNSVISVGRAAFGLVQGAAQAVPGFSQQSGLGQQVQNLVRGFDRQDIQQSIQKAAPELSPQQASATTDAVVAAGRESLDRIEGSVGNPSAIGDVMRSEADNMYRKLTGPEFGARLQAQGLNPAQAGQVQGVIRERADQLRGQIRQASDTISRRTRELTESAAGALSKGAWTWLAIAVVVMALSFFGGRIGSQEDQISNLPPELDVGGEPRGEHYRIPTDDVSSIHPHH